MLETEEEVFLPFIFQGMWEREGGEEVERVTGMRREKLMKQKEQNKRAISAGEEKGGWSGRK